MLALLYDIHGNVRALDAVLRDAAQQGVDSYFIGGDVALFGAWPEDTVARLGELEPATWIRGNGERWTAHPQDAPEPLRGATTAARAALGDELVAAHVALPESAVLSDSTRAWHGSPVSDVRSFTPEPSDDEAQLLAGVQDARLVFGHTHVPFARAATAAGRTIELVNPGSIGMPLDGDHRAAYALLHDDGTIEHRRVAYDHREVVAQLRDRFGDGGWQDRIAHRLTTARMEPV